MSKSIFEANEDRAIASIGFTDRQLLRRPSPSAENVGIWPWAWIEDLANETVSDTTTIPVFDPATAIYDVYDPNIIEVVEDSGELYFNFKEFGMYAAWCGTRFSTDFSGEVQMNFVSFDEGNWWSNEFPIESTEAETQLFGTRRAHVRGTWLYVNFSSGFAAVRPTLSNFSGASRTITNKSAVAYRVTPISIS